MIWAIVAVFCVGYLLIMFEHYIKINKAATALITGVICWTLLMVGNNLPYEVLGKLHDSVGETAGIIFFLLCAMTIVELIESHHGFDIITDRIKTGGAKKLLWVIGIITFFLSAVLDNLTTTIVMVMLLQKLVCAKEDRFLFAGIIVIAANAGGAWSPIGDVTTTMLWIGERITPMNIIIGIFLPSLANLLVPLVLATFMMRNKMVGAGAVQATVSHNVRPLEKNIIFFAGIGSLVAVPVFKTLTHLPPYMGILIGLGFLWLVTEIMHHKKDDEERMNLSVLKALRKMDMSTLLFFLGILLAVSSLEAAGVLSGLAEIANRYVHSVALLTGGIGILSAIVDNVPLVAASMAMYPVSVYPADHAFWQLLSYCAGTGGSLLIIGSAAGVAAMGIEKIEFFKYIKNVSWLALLGYVAGIGVYLLQHTLLK